MCFVVVSSGGRPRLSLRVSEAMPQMLWLKLVPVCSDVDADDEGSQEHGFRHMWLKLVMCENPHTL